MGKDDEGNLSDPAEVINEFAPLLPSQDVRQRYFAAKRSEEQAFAAAEDDRHIPIERRVFVPLSP